jgi:hypothetical protein
MVVDQSSLPLVVRERVTEIRRLPVTDSERAEQERVRTVLLLSRRKRLGAVGMVACNRSEPASFLFCLRAMCVRHGHQALDTEVAAIALRPNYRFLQSANARSSRSAATCAFRNSGSDTQCGGSPRAPQQCAELRARRSSAPLVSVADDGNVVIDESFVFVRFGTIKRDRKTFLEALHERARISARARTFTFAVDWRARTRLDRREVCACGLLAEQATCYTLLARGNSRVAGIE